MSCQWYPTIMSIAAGWTAADSDIYPAADCYPRLIDAAPWAGVARGRFSFHAHADPSRTHGGLPTQAAIEARLGRSIPDPPEASEDVLYWSVQPWLFHVRNLSGEDVTSAFVRTGGCSSFSQPVLDTEELIIGPFFGEHSVAQAWLFGASPGPGGVRTVPSGVDVRVTEASLSDPDQDWSVFACAAPAVVAA